MIVESQGDFAAGQIFDGGAGSDSFIVRDGATLPSDVTCLGIENFFLIGSNRRDILTGTEFPDRIYGLGERDFLFGLAKDDSLYGGGPGDFSLFGSNGDDTTLYGGGGGDNLQGDDGAYLLYGGGGQDLLIGGSGVDTLFGDAGNDSSVAAGQSEIGVGETLDGGSDVDSSYLAAGVTIPAAAFITNVEVIVYG